MYEASPAGSCDDLVARYAPLVKRIAYHLLARLPASVQLDDLVQAGMIGLLEAARNYDAGFGAKFETYATIRIRGAILDEVRRNDWAPRSVSRKAREVAEAIRVIEQTHGREAHEREVADSLGISVDEYHKLLAQLSGHKLLSFDDIGIEDDMDGPSLSDHSLDPFERLRSEDFVENLSRALDALPERERLVLSLYYDEELNLKEIGAVLGVSESRVCQIHGQALIRLRARVGEWNEM